ncbi:hypothetical protein [uncultured Clostridium sp.]|uniref:hypothetical protein n=1 Tax=uncultured Clostridium sp. TaxID=59620 RepID=UPI00272DDEF6|nr:hypothetical protein [uncultured Clostridium sp.]
MSKINISANLNNVSNSSIDISTIKKDIPIDNTAIENEYKYYCARYKDINFERYTIEGLKRIYETGNGLLNQYFITKCNLKNNNIYNQLQHIVNNIMYHINMKQVININKENRNLNKKLENAIKDAECLTKEMNKKSAEIKHIKNDMKSITTTIISIILAISIIPTAIAGIERISPNYILPFLSSIILFGIIMITFVYSIYQEKLKMSTWVVLGISIIICIVFWCTSFINIEKEDIRGNSNIINYTENSQSVLESE